MMPLRPSSSGEGMGGLHGTFQVQILNLLIVFTIFLKKKKS